MSKAEFCETCGIALKGRQRRYCSVNCKNKSLQSYEAQQERGLQRKLEMVQAMGGKCSKCGYAENLAAFHFHHVDPPQKGFALDLRAISNRTMDAVQVEADKCVILCANCHAELHNPRLNMVDLLRRVMGRK